MATAIETTLPVDHDDEAFARWFCENHDYAEGVELFDTTDNGIYVWKEVREGLAKWLELQKMEAQSDRGNEHADSNV